MIEYVIPLVHSFLPMFQYVLYPVFAGYFLAVVPYEFITRLTRR